MPNYKTHSIHGKLLLSNIDKKIDIDSEDIKTFSMGPDILIPFDYKLFDYQHNNKTRDYFKSIIKYIKDNKLQDDSETIAFLYGQLDHFILDILVHPLMYYMTEGIKKSQIFPTHGLVEHWIDDYIIMNFNKNDNLKYHKWSIKSKKLKEMIDKIYNRIYKSDNESYKYSLGIIFINMYDSIIRAKGANITRLFDKFIKFGDITYNKNLSRVLPYLNLKHDIWYNPETGEKNISSFYDLWNKSFELSLDTIRDVNRCIYGDGVLNNSIIEKDLSFDTGLSCERGKSLKYVKKYR